MIQQQSPSGSPQIKAKMCRYRLHIYINMSKYWLRRNRTTDFFCVLLLHQHDIVALLMKEKQICFNETLLLFINWKLFLEIFITYFSEDLCNWPHFIWQLAMIIIRKQALEVKKPDSQYQFPFMWCEIWKKLSKPPELQFVSLRRERQEPLSLAYHEKSLSWVHNMWPEQLRPGYVKRNPSLSCRVLAFRGIYFSNCDCRQTTSHSN